jgi:hypothetical protein
VRFDLIATANYATRPELSLALLKPVVGPAKWYREGEKVGHFDIQNIRDGSVVLSQGGKLTEIFVPVTAPKGKPLLKSDGVASAGTGGPSGVTAGQAGEAATPSAAGAGPADILAGRRPIRAAREAARTVDAGSRIQRVISPPATRTVTPVEQKETIAQSISSIEEIMKHGGEGVPPEERQKEQEAWTRLLKVLQQEKSSLESGEAANSDASAAPETTQPADPNEPPTAQPSSEPGTD